VQARPVSAPHSGVDHLGDGRIRGKEWPLYVRVPRQGEAVKTIRYLAWLVGLPLRILLSAVFFAIMFPLVPAEYDQIVAAIKDIWKRP